MGIISLATPFTEAATRGILRKKGFLEISQNSQENTWGRVSFVIKLQALAITTFSKPLSISNKICLLSKFKNDLS